MVGTESSLVIPPPDHAGLPIRGKHEAHQAQGYGHASRVPPSPNRTFRNEWRQPQEEEREDPDEEKCRESLRGFQRTIEVQRSRSPSTGGSFDP